MKTTDNADLATLLVISAFSAFIVWGLVIIASFPLGNLVHKLNLISWEGAVWFPMTIGIPIGFLVGIGVFILCFFKVRSYGRRQ